jgi:hypothetical protein
MLSHTDAAPAIAEVEIAHLREIDVEIAELDCQLAVLPPAYQLDPRSLAAADRNQLAHRRRTLERARGVALKSLFGADA